MNILISESIFDLHNDKSIFEKAYISTINEKYDNLLKKASQLSNYDFILAIDIEKHICTQQKNKCETNTYSFVKEKFEKGIYHFAPVGGFLFVNQSFTPVEHWWIYDEKEKKHIEITPGNDNARCYAGIIRSDNKIKKEILNSKYYHDISFFKGGNIYIKYFQ